MKYAGCFFFFEISMRVWLIEKIRGWVESTDREILLYSSSASKTGQCFDTVAFRGLLIEVCIISDDTILLKELLKINRSLVHELNVPYLI